MPRTLRKRQVFYVHGFDRRGPRYFHLWQMREARNHTKWHESEMRIGPRQGASWTLTGPKAHCEFHFMDWTQVIRRRFAVPFLRQLGSMAMLGAAALVQGFAGRIFGADRAMGALVLWAFLPVYLVVLVGVFSALLAPHLLLLWGAPILAALWLLFRLDRFTGMFYAAQIAWTARRLALRDNREIEALLADFARRLKEADPEAEVLIVGHSIGCAMAAALLEAAPPHAQLVTIGQSIPLVAFQKEAHWLRAALDRLKHGSRNWLDISAGRDSLGFSGFDPSGGGARCYSAHLAKAHGKDVLKRLRWRAFHLHFLYFKAPRYGPAAWDWLEILTGPADLEERFARETRLSGQGARRRR